MEGFWPATSRDTFKRATARLEAQLDLLRNDGIVIRIVAATLVPSDESAYWVVDAPSADVVRLAFAAVDLRVERIVGAIELRAGKATSPGRVPVTAREGATRVGG